MIKLFKIIQKKKTGFTIFFATLVASLALAIGLAIYDVVVRQLNLSTTVSQSQYAIFAADSGAECALYWDSKYNGSGSAFSGSSAATSQKKVALGGVVGSLQSWTVPADWNSSNNTIEVIGGGGGGGGGSFGGGGTRGAGGGGGGGYSKISNLALTPGASVSWQVGHQGVRGAAGGGSVGHNGTAGGDTWFNGATFAASSVAAKGGGGGLEPYDFAGWGGGGGGGSSALGIGTVKYDGGRGGYTINDGTHQGGGGGGAAGPNQVPIGNGVNGSDASGNFGGVGGAGDAGAGGAGGGIASAGGNGAEWGTIGGATIGSGGGGGGGQAWVGGGAGNYGAGGGGGGANGGGSASMDGGNGAQGIIVITYVSTSGTVTPPTSGIVCGSYDMAAAGTPPTPFAPQPTGWTPWSVVSSANAATTTFTLTFPGYSYCAVVEVAKVKLVSGVVQTSVLSHGYNTCVSGATQLERELKVTY